MLVAVAALGTAAALYFEPQPKSALSKSALSKSALSESPLSKSALPDARGGTRNSPGVASREPPAVPVSAVTAQDQNVPIILRGLGTVQAYNSVAVKSRVDGNVVQVAFTEGQFVHSGDLLFQLDPRPLQATLQQANANLAKDQANLGNAQLDLARASDLLKKGAGTEQQYATQNSTVSQLQAQLLADQAQIDAAKLNLDYASIRSPIEGVAGMRLIDIGNLVTANAASALVVVTQIKPIYVVFSLPEREIGRVRAAMAARKLKVLAFDGDDKRQISEGELTLVNNTADQTSGTVQLKAQFDNPDEALWPGQFVNAHLVIEVVGRGTTIPSSAVQAGLNGPFAYVIKPDMTVEVRQLTVRQVESNTALVSGLQAGERAVTAGQFRLMPGARVAVKEEAPNGSAARPATVAERSGQ
jgi:multidrug efflux system membrane fusion protein